MKFIALIMAAVVVVAASAATTETPKGTTATATATEAKAAAASVWSQLTPKQQVPILPTRFFRRLFINVWPFQIDLVDLCG